MSFQKTQVRKIDRQTVPSLVVASGASVVISDLGITVGKEEVNLYKIFGEKRLKKSLMLQQALKSGLVVRSKKKQENEDL